MFYEEQYPDVSLSDWETFRAQFNRHSYVEVLSRYDAVLPEWFFPLARGVIVAGDEFWTETMRMDTHFVKLSDWFWSNHPLKVREWEAVRPLWSVEMWTPSQVYEFDEVLVHTFGATPIFATDSYTARRIATHCHFTGPLPGTRWMKFPGSIQEVERQVDYASVRDDLAYLRTVSAQLSKQVH